MFHRRKEHVQVCNNFRGVNDDSFLGELAILLGNVQKTLKPIPPKGVYQKHHLKRS